MVQREFAWNDGSGQFLTAEWGGEGDGEIRFSSPANPSASAARQLSFAVKTTKGEPELSCNVTVMQSASEYIYVLKASASAEVIGAGGGTSDLTFILSTYMNGSLVSEKEVSPSLSISGEGFSLSGQRVTAADREFHLGDERECEVSYAYKTEETSEELAGKIVIVQEENIRWIASVNNVFSDKHVIDGMTWMESWKAGQAQFGTDNDGGYFDGVIMDIEYSSGYKDEGLQFDWFAAFEEKGGFEGTYQFRLDDVIGGCSLTSEGLFSYPENGGDERYIADIWIQCTFEKYPEKRTGEKISTSQQSWEVHQPGGGISIWAIEDDFEVQ